MICNRIVCLLTVYFLIGGCGFHAGSGGRKQPADSPDFAKLMAMQVSAAALTPLENVDIQYRDVPFITKDDSVSIRPIRIYLPAGTSGPVPVVFVPHYEMKEDALELRSYLDEGWAVVSPSGFEDRYNGQLTDDDLVFNNAVLYAIRHDDRFDPERILLVGGSAGGYMTMMLNALQMGICASVAKSPIQNAYFNFYRHFSAASDLNKKAWVKFMLKNGRKLSKGAPEEKTQALMEAMQTLPFPILGLISGLFEPILENFPDKEDTARWEALSPVGLGDCYTSPFLVWHCTSDLLVPVDQTSRRFTYANNGKSMPRRFSTRLDPGYPGHLGCSLEEVLPPDQTFVASLALSQADSVMTAVYDPGKAFNINIVDDGPVESYGGHSSMIPTRDVDVLPYLRDMVDHTSRRTEVLRPEKLRLLLERYLGASVQLPAHEGVDDTVYGSLAIYRQEVQEELTYYAKRHSLDEVDQMAASLEDERLLGTWEQIKADYFPDINSEGVLPN